MSYSNGKVARNLKIERVKRGWSQERLAEASGVGQNSIARYETGTTTPGLDQAFKIASALGCSIDDLVGWKPPEKTGEDSAA